MTSGGPPAERVAGGHDASEERTRGRRTALAVGAGAVVLVVGVAVVLGTTGNGAGLGGSDGPSTASPAPTAPSSSASPTTTPAPSPEGSGAGTTPVLTTEEAVQAADDVLRRFLESRDAVLQGGGTDTAPLQGLAAGAALAEAVARADELVGREWRQEGAVQVASVDAVTVDLAVPSVELLACIDGSDVRLVDASGTPIQPDQDGRRVPSTYGVVLDGDTWLVTAQGFPAEPSC